MILEFECNFNATLNRESKIILEEKLIIFSINNKEIDLNEEKGNILCIVNRKMERGMK